MSKPLSTQSATWQDDVREARQLVIYALGDLGGARRKVPAAQAKLNDALDILRALLEEDE